MLSLSTVTEQGWTNPCSSKPCEPKLSIGELWRVTSKKKRAVLYWPGENIDLNAVGSYTWRSKSNFIGPVLQIRYFSIDLRSLICNDLGSDRIASRVLNISME